MLKAIKLDRDKQKEEFPGSYKRLITIIDPYDYCNIIADNIKATPDYFKILFTNPKLYYKIIIGSWNHHVYRLNDNRKNIRQYCQENIKKNFKNETSISIRKVTFIILVNTILYYISYLFLILIIYIFYNKKL